MSAAWLRVRLSWWEGVSELGERGVFAAPWVIVASWLLLILLVLTSGQSATSGSSTPMSSMGMSMPGMNMSGMSMPGMSMSSHTSASAAVAMTLPIWTLMIAAMMLPSALPALVHVASHTYRWRRRRAVTKQGGWAPRGLTADLKVAHMDVINPSN